MPIRKISNSDLEKVDYWLKKEFNSSYSKNDFSTTIVYYEEEILGFLTYSFMYDRAEIDYIYVLKNKRRNGIASKLLDYMIKQIGDISISLEVKVDNDEAINFYKKNGFEIVAKREKYYQGIDGYLMVRGEV